MNEKVKKVLRIAGIVGICALLFALGCGLGYCSAQKTGEPTKVLTERSRKNAKGTTSVGGYDKYTFDIPLDFEQDKTKSWLYSFDTPTWSPTLVETLTEGSPQNRFEVASYYNSAYEGVYDQRKSDGNIYLVVGSGNTPFWSSTSYTMSVYVSFLVGLNPQNTNQATQTFICTSNTTYYSYPIDATSSNWGFTTNSTNRNILISYNKTDVFFQWSGNLPTTITFQDIASYYLEQGYASGYEDGYESGTNVGYWQGYNEGIEQAGNFTNITANKNAVIDLREMGSSDTTTWYSHNLSSARYYSLLQFRDNNEDGWAVYLEDGIDSNQPTGTRTFYINLYCYSTQTYKGWIGYGLRNTNANTFSVQQTNEYSFEFAYIFNVVNRALSDRLVLVWGWVSDNISYEAGYNVGYEEGFKNTNTKNVFSLFTGAFGAVANFFEIKVFGFLPLYWFFLTPIFVAIITLLLRMVKH